MTSLKPTSNLFFAGVLAVLCSLVTRTEAGVATLYYVDYPAPTTTDTDPLSYERFGTTIYSALGPAQESGVTRYEGQEVMSQVIYHGGKEHGTHTILSVPTTLTWTFEQGASVHRERYPGEKVVTILADKDNAPIVFRGYDANCTLDLEKKEGECVDGQILPLPTPVTTVDGKETLYSTLLFTRTTTYKGSLVPFATVTSTSGAPGLCLSKGVTVGGAVVTMVGAFALLL